MATILVVEDKESLRSMLEEMLRAEGWSVIGSGSGSDAIERLRAGENVDLVLTDWRLPGADGLEVLDVARSVDRRARQRESMLFAEERSRLIPPIVGSSAALKAVQAEARRVAETDAAVLLEGESGTGKELFARAIHGLSMRSRRPFVAINCAAIPDTLLESELFGHEKGSFTGASSRRLGKFELADGGSVFLDEIGELTPATQGKLLRVLQEKSFHRVGGTAVINVDVRIITASNRPLDRLVAQNLFREDLYYRVRVFPIFIPPLRERPEDIDSLIDWFLARLPGELKKKPLALDGAARERLRRYSWPGNVRELRNCLERAIILAEGRTIEERHLRLTPDAPSPLPAGRDETLEEVRERGARAAERAWLARALERAKGDRTAAAEALKLSPRRFEAKLKEHSLDQ